jgi:hypothetical protein
VFESAVLCSVIRALFGQYLVRGLLHCVSFWFMGCIADLYHS